ncbi:MAG TPA: glycerophosphodiester phosphodiesterase [Solirubrobacteraceae bacterium]|jgi:glycerophosphoryl diester phosphodiesterase|nr:glycerophosphodiester phosphodiesterase [Solirubrobacteraceae bacterium]
MPPALIAHRCGRAYGPDSSRRALRTALRRGALYGVETDVCLTRDGALVCLHDPYLPHATTATGWAHERRGADLLTARLLDRDGRPSAERPLLLDELLDLVPAQVTVQLDVKAHADEELARRTVSALATRLARRGDADRIEVLSFHAAAVQQAAACAMAARLVIWADYAPAALARWAADVGLRGVCIEHFLLGPATVGALREAGLSLTTGTVNCAALAERALAYEPDALTSDRPHELAAELADRARLAA